MPIYAPLVKVQSTRNFGAEVLLHGHSFDEAYSFAQGLSAKNGWTFVPAFDHPNIICGQGTVAIEILNQLEGFDSVIVPIGGGGLISGIAKVLKERNPNIFIMGVQSKWALDAQKGAFSGNTITRPLSIADGIAVKQPGAITGPIIKELVDDIVVLDEVDIAKCIIFLLENERAVIEGAGAVGFGPILHKRLPDSCKRTVIVVSGSNIDVNVLSRLIERDLRERDRIFRIRVSLPDRPGSLHFLTGIIAEQGANILETHHDRSFSTLPGNVNITVLMEVRDKLHKGDILLALRNEGLDSVET